jgi:hypothetical protein
MNDFESQLSTMLANRAAEATPIDQLDDVFTGTGTVHLLPATTRRWRPVFSIAAAVLLVVAGLAVLKRRNADQVKLGSSAGVAFVTQNASLTADDFWIDIDGKRFTSKGAKLDLNSDLGDANYQSLEVVWTEHDVEMRLNIYFKADGNQWWSDEFRTSNGKPSDASDWVTFTGDFFRSTLGSPENGTFDQTATEGGVTSHIHIDGMRLQAFLDQGPGGMTVPTSSTVPVVVAGQAPPLAADLPVTGIAWSTQDNAAFAVAHDTLQRECMTAKGWKYPARTSQDWALQLGGMWDSGPVLGAVGGKYVSQFGYHDTDFKSTDPVERYVQSLSAPEQERFGQDDTGPARPAPVGSVLKRVGDSCLDRIAGSFGPAYDQSQLLSARFQTEAMQVKAANAARNDSLVKAALLAWSTCVKSAVGESAETPNELLRRYVRSDAPALTDREKEIAVADVGCQRQVDLWTVYHTALASRQRILVGADVTSYDLLTRLHQTLASTARQILDERNITVPSLD